MGADGYVGENQKPCSYLVEDDGGYAHSRSDSIKHKIYFQIYKGHTLYILREKRRDIETCKK